MNEYLNQEEIAKASICLAKAMIYYGAAGPDDNSEVADYIARALNKVSDKLSPENQEKFVQWITKKRYEVLSAQ